MDTAITTTLIASGSAIGGVLIKMAYDAVSAHADVKRASADKFLIERKAACDKFWAAHKEVVEDQERLHVIALIARAGKTVKDGILESFPESSMGSLVAALDELRRIAHTAEMVTICERIVVLHGDASVALRHFLDTESIQYGLPLFVANRLREDQELEFIVAYRKDLGIGLPVGVSEDWLKVKRPWPLPTMERLFHEHVKHGLPTSVKESLFPRPLTARDAELVESPKYKAMMAESPSSSADAALASEPGE